MLGLDRHLLPHTLAKEVVASNRQLLNFFAGTTTDNLLAAGISQDSASNRDFLSKSPQMDLADIPVSWFELVRCKNTNTDQQRVSHPAVQAFLAYIHNSTLDHTGISRVLMGTTGDVQEYLINTPYLTFMEDFAKGAFEINLRVPIEEMLSASNSVARYRLALTAVCTAETWNDGRIERWCENNPTAIYNKALVDGTKNVFLMQWYGLPDSRLRTTRNRIQTAAGIEDNLPWRGGLRRLGQVACCHGRSRDLSFLTAFIQRSLDHNLSSECLCHFGSMLFEYFSAFVQSRKIGIDPQLVISDVHLLIQSIIGNDGFDSIAVQPSSGNLGYSFLTVDKQRVRKIDPFRFPLSVD